MTARFLKPEPVSPGEIHMPAMHEGLGRIWLQSLPFSRMADRIVTASRGGREEGSVLGGLGRMLDGDN